MADNFSQICLWASCQRYFAHIDSAMWGRALRPSRAKFRIARKNQLQLHIRLAFGLSLRRTSSPKNYILAVDETEQIIARRRRGEPLICRIRRKSKLNVAVSKKYYVCVSRKLFDRRLQIKPKSSMFVVTKICVRCNTRDSDRRCIHRLGKKKYPRSGACMRRPQRQQKR